MKNILVITVMILLTSCTAERSNQGDLTRYLPANSAVVLKLHHPDLFFSNLRNNHFLRTNKNLLISPELEQELEALNLFPHEDPAFISFSTSSEKKTNFLFATKANSEHFADSLLHGTSGNQQLSERQLREFSMHEQIAYATIIDSTFLLSNSADYLNSALNRKNMLSDSPDFLWALKAASRSKPAILLNHKYLKEILQRDFSDNFIGLTESIGSWTLLNGDLSQQRIQLDGISTAGDSLSYLIDIFRDVAPKENRVSQVMPSSGKGFYSVTFDEFSGFYRNLTEMSGINQDYKDTEAYQLLERAEEAGTLWLAQDTVFAIRIKKEEAVRNPFRVLPSATENHRGIDILKLENSRNMELLKPLFEPGELHYLAILDPFYLFSKTPQGLKEVITSFQNGRVAGQDENFIAAAEDLSSSSSLLLVLLNNSESRLLDHVTLPGSEFDAVSFDQYPLTAVQWVHQDNYAHVHMLLAQAKELNSADEVSQVRKVTFAANVVERPYFFKNHRSDGLDIAVQDAKNTLYLISENGKIHWKRNLESRIMGKVHAVDLFRNGRIQLAFTTQNQLHVIDRDANDVAPFPLVFKDAITQPLAVFDYDNKRKYRFVVVQNNRIYMYNNKGESVRGFTLDKTSHQIMNPPKHVRIGRKDYILIQENSGKLNILDRTGKIRVPVEENFNFSGNQWYEHHNAFISTSADAMKLRIDEQGNVSRDQVDLVGDHLISADENSFVSISDNELSINGHKISMDYGLYTRPQIFSINSKIYIALTDLQAHKVYIFNQEAGLLPGFPVYGTSAVDMGNADKDAAPELLVRGEKNSILLYEIN